MRHARVLVRAAAVAGLAALPLAAGAAGEVHAAEAGDGRGGPAATADPGRGGAASTPQSPDPGTDTFQAEDLVATVLAPGGGTGSAGTAGDATDDGHGSGTADDRDAEYGAPEDRVPDDRTADRRATADDATADRTADDDAIRADATGDARTSAGRAAGGVGGTGGRHAADDRGTIHGSTVPTGLGSTARDPARHAVDGTTTTAHAGSEQPVGGHAGTEPSADARALVGGRPADPVTALVDGLVGPTGLLGGDGLVAGLLGGLWDGPLVAVEAEVSPQVQVGGVLSGGPVVQSASRAG